MILGPNNFISTLVELKHFLKFNLTETVSNIDNPKSNYDILIFHDNALKNIASKDIINKSTAIKILASSKNDTSVKYDSFLKLPATIDEINEEGLVGIIDIIVASKNIVVSTNAFDLTFDQNNNEIYGISKLIIWAVKNNYLLVVSDPSSNYYSWIKKNFPNLLSPNVLFIPFSHNFVAILKYVNFFIRNTTTDGDSVSIHEALASDVTVYATNCVSRPDNVIVYDDLDKVQLTPNKQLSSVKTSNTLHTMIDIYSKL